MSFDHEMTFLLAMWAVFLELAPWLLLGAAVAGALHATLPPGLVERELRGRAGVLKAVAVGVPLPLCSCGVIPAGLGLRSQGASRGATVGFLISTPQTGLDSVLVSASFLGWPFAAFKVVSALLLGVVGGYATEALTHDAAAGDVARPVAAQALPRGLAARLRRAWEHALMLVRTIWRWIAFGVIVSAAITTWLPPGAFAGLSAYGGALALVSVLAVSLPLYVCATASVPIAAALVAQGFPAGAALVFLMAGPATNVATVGAVSRAFGPRVLAVYLVTLIAGSLAAGALFDSVLPGASQLAASTMHAEHAPSLAAVGAAVLLAGGLLWFAIDDLREWARGRLAAARARDAEVCTLELGVQGMSCQGCVRKVRGALASVPGVEDVQVELEPGRARVRGQVEREVLEAAVREAGFATESTVSP